MRHSCLKEAARRRIEELAEQGHRAVAIGRAVDLKGPTVRWYLYTIGMVAPSRAIHPPMCIRNGRLVRRFKPAEDALLLSMRRRGEKFEAIATECNRRYESHRTASSVYQRLTILARDEE